MFLHKSTRHDSCFAQEHIIRASLFNVRTDKIPRFLSAYNGNQECTHDRRSMKIEQCLGVYDAYHIHHHCWRIPIPLESYRVVKYNYVIESTKDCWSKINKNQKLLICSKLAIYTQNRFEISMPKFKKFHFWVFVPQVWWGTNCCRIH